ncbi:MAG: putative rane protein [Glaciihabitans sp.]|jgi:putative MFS transporter|nr:putative rane protein [Glaciihabitans sp.]
MTGNDARNLTTDPAVSTVSGILDVSPVTRWHRRLVVLIGAGSFFNFVEVALSSLLVPLIGLQWTLNPQLQAGLISATFVGEAIGSLVLSPLADRFGRSRMFQVNLLLYVVFTVASAFAPGPTILIALRVLLGIGLGAELTLVDSYLSEMMPRKSRGRLVAWSYTFGLLAVPIIGALTVFFPHSIGGIAGWRFILGVAAIGGLIVWLLRRRLPESPRWLVAHGRDAEARLVLAQMSGVAVAGDVDDPAPPGESLPEPSRLQIRRRRVLLVLMNTLSPIGFYGFASIAPLVLVDKGYSIVHSLIFTALSALGYPLGSVVSALLVERVQRRNLLIGASLAVAVFGISFGLAGSPVLVVIAGFLTGLSSVVQSNVTHIYQAELFPTKIRARSIGLPYALSRVIGAALPFATLPILYALGAGPLFALCGTLIVVLAIAVAILGPRTNARSLDAI